MVPVPPAFDPGTQQLALIHVYVTDNTMAAWPEPSSREVCLNMIDLERQERGSSPEM